MCTLASLLGSFQSRGTLKEVGISCSPPYGGLPVRFWQGYLQWSMCLRRHAGVSAQENNIWRTQLVVVVTVGTGFQTLQDMNILAVLPHTDSKASFWLVTDCLLSLISFLWPSDPLYLVVGLSCWREQFHELKSYLLPNRENFLDLNTSYQW